MADRTRVTDTPETYPLLAVAESLRRQADQLERSARTLRSEARVLEVTAKGSSRMKDEATRAFDACEAVAETLSERGIEINPDDVAAVTEAALRAYREAPDG